MLDLPIVKHPALCGPSFAHLFLLHAERRLCTVVRCFAFEVAFIVRCVNLALDTLPSFILFLLQPLLCPLRQKHRCLPQKCCLVQLLLQLSQRSVEHLLTRAHVLERELLYVALAHGKDLVCTVLLWLRIRVVRAFIIVMCDRSLHMRLNDFSALRGLDFSRALRDLSR